MNQKREDMIRALTNENRTREQAEAFLDILGSGLVRRGLIKGEPLSEEALSERLDTFIAKNP